MENIGFLVLVLVLNLITAVLLMKNRYVNQEDGQDGCAIGRRFLLIYSCVFVLLNLAIAVFFIYMYPENTFLYSAKRFCVLSLLWPIGLIDYKTYKIPNPFIVYGLVCRGLILVAELFFEPDLVLGEFVSELIVAAAVGVAAILCSVCIRNSIGFGDIKLFLVMGLLLGADGTWSAIFVSLIIAFILTLFLLITKKKGKKDVVAFAPSAMIGTYISVILTGM